jgi:hypothetical protein
MGSFKKTPSSWHGRAEEIQSGTTSVKRTYHLDVDDQGGCSLSVEVILNLDALIVDVG